MLRKFAAGAGAAVASLVVFTTIAFADSGSITDPKGDGHEPWRTATDIVRAGWGHTDSGRLKHWVAVDGTIARLQTASGHGGILPELNIKVPGFDSGDPHCDYWVGPVPPGYGGNTTDQWQYRVLVCGSDDAQSKGAARYVRPTEHRIVLRFGRHAIGNPGHYRWAWQFGDYYNGIQDRAPDKGFTRHDL